MEPDLEINASRVVATRETSTSIIILIDRMRVYLQKVIFSLVDCQNPSSKERERRWERSAGKGKKEER